MTLPLRIMGLARWSSLDQTCVPAESVLPCREGLSVPMQLSRRQFISLAAAAPAALALGGCSLGLEDKGPIAERLIDAVATIGMVGDLVTNVGRDRVDL